MYRQHTRAPVHTLRSSIHNQHTGRRLADLDARCRKLQLRPARTGSEHRSRHSTACHVTGEMDAGGRRGRGFMKRRERKEAERGGVR
eukprot:1404516-Rhodomonas_salina.5